MDAVSAKPVFSGDPLAAEEPQRPFRVSGLVALLLGVVSFSALFSTNLLFLPALAIFFALVALRPARDRNVQPSGRGMAWAGIVLALFFSGWSVAQHTTRMRYLAADGEGVARNWLTVLASGQLELAHELTLPAGARQMPSMPLREYYANDKQATEQLREFETMPPVRQILGTGDQLQWEFMGVILEGRTYGADQMLLRFKELSGKIDRPLNIVVERSPAGADKAEWRVKEYTFVDQGPRF